MNKMLPGNPRYQPKQMIEIFGYDNLYQAAIAVELATLETLRDLKIVPEKEYAAISKEVAKKIKAITTTEVDELERSVTHHDIRALVKIIQEIINDKLKRWVHIPLTSYDVLDTGRSLQFLTAYHKALKPGLQELTHNFITLMEKYADTLQIGRTHGQHALPITVGFWLASILDRILFNWRELDRYANGLRGKISGAVGAYNAQLALAFQKGNDDEESFEDLVLKKLGLKPASISTQILPPEPLAYFLFSATMLSATLGQFGRDCRNLMRSEIGEVRESFGAHQVGSSTMAHKRNPITFENLEGTWLKNKCEFNKVLETLISEHQRDLVGSSILRDLPVIVINLQHQLNALNKKKDGLSFLQRLEIDEQNCQQNFLASADFILAEPIYIALQMYGYSQDAHELVNRTLMSIAKERNTSLFAALQIQAENDLEIREIMERIPMDMKISLSKPEEYTGLASQKVAEVALRTTMFLATIQ